MGQTKITIKIWAPLHLTFSNALEKRFIKRDAFLNHMIMQELPHIESELAGLKQSDVAKRHVSSQLSQLDLKTVNVVVDKSVAERLSSLVQKSNLVRDALLNRIILFLLSPDWLLQHFDIPKTVDSPRFHSAESMPTSPLGAIRSVLYDPMFYLRIDVHNSGERSLYLLQLPDINGIDLTGLTCYLNDSFVPETKDFEQRIAAEKEASDLLGFIDL
jgi:hypothetical protein